MPRILILTANSKSDPLELSKEIHEIRSAIGEYSNYKIHYESEVQSDDFIRLLIQHKPDILHFAGHGGREQGITLRAGDKGAPLSATELGSILKEIAIRPKLIVLNACWSREFDEKLTPHVQAFVGTNGKIGDAAARCFAKSFYTCLASGHSVLSAFDLSKITVKCAGHDESLLQIACPEQVNPAGLVFYSRPELLVSFQMNKNKPKMFLNKRYKRMSYKLLVSLRGADQHVESVTYQVCHHTFQKRFWEVSRTTNARFETEFHSYGEVILRAVAWSKDAGVGVESSLVVALERRYGEHAEPSVAKAIDVIRSQ